MGTNETSKDSQGTYDETSITNEQTMLSNIVKEEDAIVVVNGAIDNKKCEYQLVNCDR